MTERLERTRELRTCETHPIRVDYVPESVLRYPGLLGMCMGPGKRGPGYGYYDWDRDLSTDLDRLRDEYAVGALVTLMETWELAHWGMADLFAAAEIRGIQAAHLPIRDVDVPDCPEPLLETLDWMRERLRRGVNVAVHCRGGHGRAGLVVAAFLAVEGYASAEAIRITRAARTGTIQTRHQEQYVGYVRALVRNGRESQA